MEINNNETDNFKEENNSHKLQSPNLNDAKDKSFIFWIFFCITIISMGIVYFIAINQVENIKIDQNGKIVVTEKFIKHFEKSLPQNYQYIDRNIAVNAKNSIDVIINEEIDRVFEPVYNQISKFSDFHYSLSGEYTEIATALAGRISESVKNYLFDSIGFDNKLEVGVNNIIQKSNDVFSKAIDTTHNDIEKELNLNSKEFSLLSKSFMEISIDDMQKRFSNYIVDGIRTGGIVTGAGAGVAGALIAKKVGAKVAAKIAIKIAAKLGIKVAGGAGTAATGTYIGSFFGPIGTAIGGIVGGVAGWVITDKIIVEIDQYINEEDFKDDLRQLISQQKQEMKDTFINLYGNFLNSTTDNMKNDIRDMKLKDYINNSN